MKGGGRGLVSGKRPVDDAVKATDFDNLDLLPADFSYRNMDLELDDAKKRTRRLDQLLSGVADDYDVAFLDCPPSVSLVSENVLRAADVLLVPLIPATLSLRTYAQLTRFVADAPRPRPQVVAFFSMADRRKRLHREVIDAIPRDRGRIADTVIPSMALIEQMAERRAPVPAFAPTSRAAKCYEQLWAEVRRWLVRAWWSPARECSDRTRRRNHLGAGHVPPRRSVTGAHSPARRGPRGLEVVPGLVELEVAVPRLSPAVR